MRIAGIALCVSLTASFLGACAGHDIQTTSGADYLAAYQHQPLPASSGASSLPSGIDERVAQIAAVEPDLRFPGRFGVARIVNGQLSPIPDAEAELWAGLAERHPDLGAFLPISPLVAELASRSAGRSSGARSQNTGYVIETIRLGAARQHVDAVLIYEVGASSTKDPSVLAFADLTIIGGAFLPTRVITAEGRAAALFVDVRNGYPYGTANASADLTSYFMSWGSDRETAIRQQEASRTVVENLVPEVEAMFIELKEAFPPAA